MCDTSCPADRFRQGVGQWLKAYSVLGAMALRHGRRAVLGDWRPVPELAHTGAREVLKTHSYMRLQDGIYAIPIILKFRWQITGTFMHDHE
jgi:hypothetical protein